MRICSAQTSDHRLVVSARDAAYILDERSSLQTLKNFSAETTLRQLVTAMEPWPGVELGDLAEITDTYTGEAAPGSLLDVAEQVCQELDIGFRLRFDPAEKKADCSSCTALCWTGTPAMRPSTATLPT